MATARLPKGLVELSTTFKHFDTRGDATAPLDDMVAFFKSKQNRVLMSFTDGAVARQLQHLAAVEWNGSDTVTFLELLERQYPEASPHELRCMHLNAYPGLSGVGAAGAGAGGDAGARRRPSAGGSRMAAFLQLFRKQRPQSEEEAVAAEVGRHVLVNVANSLSGDMASHERSDARVMRCRVASAGEAALPGGARRASSSIVGVLRDAGLGGQLTRRTSHLGHTHDGPSKQVMLAALSSPTADRLSPAPPAPGSRSPLKPPATATAEAAAAATLRGLSCAGSLAPRSPPPHPYPHPRSPATASAAVGRDRVASTAWEAPPTTPRTSAPSAMSSAAAAAIAGGHQPIPPASPRIYSRQSCSSGLTPHSPSVAALLARRTGMSRHEAAVRDVVAGARCKSMTGEAAASSSSCTASECGSGAAAAAVAQVQGGGGHRAAASAEGDRSSSSTRQGSGSAWPAQAAAASTSGGAHKVAASAGGDHSSSSSTHHGDRNARPSSHPAPGTSVLSPFAALAQIGGEGGRHVLSPPSGHCPSPAPWGSPIRPRAGSVSVSSGMVGAWCFPPRGAAQAGEGVASEGGAVGVGGGEEEDRHTRADDRLEALRAMRRGSRV
ncbi:hypothetical protein FOA52_006914 [Chlamydomonas sp. UWO 241]|nr:hypothetical protein FOA52_006914 [Chlamydomonas sp. UWO 241]